MKLLSGKEIADFIKQRHLRQVSGIIQAFGIQPKIVILRTKDDPTINLYTKIKQDYGSDIGVEVENRLVKQAEITDVIDELNNDPMVHGIIVQLPLENDEQADKILNKISPHKDIDGLNAKSEFDSATATAIIWLLNGYNIDLKNKEIVLVGQGRLVGTPLNELLKSMDFKPIILDEHSKNIAEFIAQADILITATGQAGLIKSGWIKDGAVIIDAGVAVENGEVKGDVEESIFERDNLKITPKKGGVGPLTVAVLFDNLLRSVK